MSELSVHILTSLTHPRVGGSQTSETFTFPQHCETPAEMSHFDPWWSATNRIAARGSGPGPRVVVEIREFCPVY